jgi:hypothetical protein
VLFFFSDVVAANILSLVPVTASPPGLVSVTDLNTGRSVSVSPTSSPSIALIIGLVIAGLVLLAIVIVIIVLCCRRHKHQKDTGAFYVPLSKEDVAPVSSRSKLLNLSVIQAAVASGEATVSVSAGMIVQADPVDFANTSSEWLWVKLPNGTAGYVPREFCRLV